MDWNLKEAAIECGVPAASWKNWERGTSEPRRLVETCALISTRTGCDLLWLITGSTTGRQIPIRLGGGAVTEEYQGRTVKRQVETLLRGGRPLKSGADRPRSNRPSVYPHAARRPQLLHSGSA